MARLELQRQYAFEAAHRNIQGDERTSRLHGHNFVVRVLLEDLVNPRSGWFADFAEVDAIVLPVIEQLDHQYINDVVRLPNARLQDIAGWIENQLTGKSPDVERVIVSLEGGAPGFNLKRIAADPELNYPERLSFYVECAHLLPEVYEGHKCGAVHGHSFRIEVGAANLDALTPAFRSIYDTLDHQFLNEVEGISNPTSENLAQWVWARLEGSGVELQVVLIHETPGAYCVYRGLQS